MKAILCTRLGTPDDLELAELPDPVAQRGEVVVKIAAIGLNFFDTLIIAGKYQTKPLLPFSPGGEFSGVVESVGADAGDFAPGDRVLGYVTYGATRERAAVPAQRLFKLTNALDLERAAGLTVTYGTAYHALMDRARLQYGETLVVLGASGGVGLATVELGKLMGARVIACAGSDEKLAFIRAHGADETVNYAKTDLREALKHLGGEHGIDVIFDPVGGLHSEAALRAIAWEGRHLVVGFAAGDIPRLPLNLVLLKGCAVTGVFFSQWVRRHPEGLRAALEQITGWCAEGKLSGHIHAAYPLAETGAALKALTDRRVMGKVIVRP